MAELFRFEISKIFRKKLVLFSVLGVLAFSGMMIISWGVNAYPIQGTDVMKHYTRKEAQKMNRDFLRQYQGKLTDEKVKAIIDSCRRKAENDEPRTYTELMIQKIFLDDNDQIRKVSEVFPEIGNQLVLGDVMGWDDSYVQIWKEQMCHCKSGSRVYDGNNTDFCDNSDVCTLVSDTVWNGGV